LTGDDVSEPACSQPRNSVRDALARATEPEEMMIPAAYKNLNKITKFFTKEFKPYRPSSDRSNNAMASTRHGRVPGRGDQRDGRQCDFRVHQRSVPASGAPPRIVGFVASSQRRRIFVNANRIAEWQVARKFSFGPTRLTSLRAWRASTHELVPFLDPKYFVGAMYDNSTRTPSATVQSVSRNKGFIDQLAGASSVCEIFGTFCLKQQKFLAVGTNRIEGRV
jgi:hypothetical protein